MENMLSTTQIKLQLNSFIELLKQNLILRINSNLNKFEIKNDCNYDLTKHEKVDLNYFYRIEYESGLDYYFSNFEIFINSTNDFLIFFDSEHQYSQNSEKIYIQINNIIELFLAIFYQDLRFYIQNYIIEDYLLNKDKLNRKEKKYVLKYNKIKAKNEIIRAEQSNKIHSYFLNYLSENHVKYYDLYNAIITKNIEKLHQEISLSESINVKQDILKLIDNIQNKEPVDRRNLYFKIWRYFIFEDYKTIGISIWKPSTFEQKAIKKFPLIESKKLSEKVGELSRKSYIEYFLDFFTTNKELLKIEEALFGKKIRNSYEDSVLMFIKFATKSKYYAKEHI